MKIYDRWGGIVYEGENKGWDGKNATSGQYFYSIEIIDYKNKLEKEIGQVTQCICLPFHLLSWQSFLLFDLQLINLI